MKVLWFSNTPASGENYLGDKVIRGGWLKSLDKELKHHLDLHVAFNYPKFSNDFEFEQVHYYPICFKNWRFALLKSILSIPQNENERLKIYLDVINKVKPDLIHIHGSESTYINIQHLTNVPIVLSIQGNNNGYVRKYTSSLSLKELSFIPYNLKKGLKWNLMLKSLKKEYYSILKNTKIERSNFFNIKNIIGRTDWDRRLSNVLAPKSVYFHNDEILRDIFYKSVWVPPAFSIGDKLIIHTTGGVNTYKGIFTICEAVNELNLLNVNFEWNIFGVNPDDLIIELLKRKLKNLFPKKNIYFQGNASEIELSNSLLRSHIFVQSSHIENSPNSLCEAMILGMPCIATFAGGTSSLLTDKNDGILIQDGDPFSMAGAILELRNNYDLAIKYGKSSRNRALLRHDKSKIVNDLLNIYSGILKK
jgi:glycosyltransferase involved in cell wall biosynthesis